MAGTITINTPAGVDGDILIAFVAAGHANNFGGDSEINPDEAGWNLLRRASIDLGAGAGIQYACWWRLATAGDPASFDFSWVDPTNSAFAGHIYRADNPDPFTPIQDDAAVVVQPAADPLVIDAPSLTAVAERLPRLVVMHLANSETNGPWTVPGGMTQRAEVATTAAVVPLAMQVADEAILAGGATGVRQASYANGGGNPIQGMAYAVLIEPACNVPD